MLSSAFGWLDGLGMAPGGIGMIVRLVIAALLGLGIGLHGRAFRQSDATAEHAAFGLGGCVAAAILPAALNGLGAGAALGDSPWLFVGALIAIGIGLWAALGRVRRAEGSLYTRMVAWMIGTICADGGIATAVLLTAVALTFLSLVYLFFGWIEAKMRGDAD